MADPADRQARRPWRDKVPAVLTAVDTSYSPARYSWFEQTYDASGNRMTRANGRTGTAAYSPAYAYGDGMALGNADLPMPVTLRRRCDTDTLGPVYEFPLYCACVGGGSGSGSGFAFVVCCPNPLPRTLTATFTVLTGTCAGLNGYAVPLVFTATAPAEFSTLGPGWYAGFINLPFGGTHGGSADVYSLYFPQGGQLGQCILGVTSFTDSCVISGSGFATSLTCDPFLYYNASFSLAGACAGTCGAATFAISITE